MNIIELAKEAGFSDHYLATVQLHELERFAALVRADEREECIEDVRTVGGEFAVECELLIRRRWEKNK